MSEVDSLYACCGVGVIGEIEYGTPIQILRSVFVDNSDSEYTLDFGAYVFTEHGNYKYGQRLAAFIRKKGLGSVTTSRNFRNPHHPGHRGIRLFVWIPNHRKLGSFARTTEKKRKRNGNYY